MPQLAIPTYLEEQGIIISMAVKRDPYDNAYIKSFFKALKSKAGGNVLWQYETYLDVITRIPYFILDVYNRKRLHSALGYRPPEEYGNLLVENASQKHENTKTLFV